MKNTFVYIFFTCAFLSSYICASAQELLTDNKKINSLIEKKREYNKHNSSGYRIQLYYGNEKKAKVYENNFRVTFPGIFCKRYYDNPYWNVKVGRYRTRLDAERALNKIRDKFSGAIIIKK